MLDLWNSLNTRWAKPEQQIQAATIGLCLLPTDFSMEGKAGGKPEVFECVR